MTCLWLMIYTKRCSGYHITAKWYPYFPRKVMLLSSGLEIVEAENSFISWQFRPLLYGVMPREHYSAHGPLCKPQVPHTKCQPLTTESWARFWASTWTTWHWNRFLSGYIGLLCEYCSTIAPYSYFMPLITLLPDSHSKGEGIIEQNTSLSPSHIHVCVSNCCPVQWLHKIKPQMEHLWFICVSMDALS